MRFELFDTIKYNICDFHLHFVLFTTSFGGMTQILFFLIQNLEHRMETMETNFQMGQALIRGLLMQWKECVWINSAMILHRKCGMILKRSLHIMACRL